MRHTKFFPDAGFDMLKHKYKLTKVGCLDDIVKVVNQSVLEARGIIPTRYDYSRGVTTDTSVVPL